MITLPVVVARRIARAGWVTGRHLARRAAARAGLGTRPTAVDLLAELGPAFVKAAQLLSTRPDQLPAAWCERLGQLYDRVPRPGPGTVEAALRLAYGNPGPFAELSAEPLASGSIATVHRACLPDGTAVAVKVLRPGVARALHDDLQVLRFGARLCAALPPLRRSPVAEIAEQLGAALLGQVDLIAERHNLGLLRSNLATLPYVRVPAAIDELCTGEVLVMELVAERSRLDPALLPPEQRRRLVRRTLSTVYRMLFVDGFVHCDLHPGNLYADADGNVVVLDAGFVVRLPGRVRDLFREFFLNMALGRGERCAEIVLDSAAAAPPDTSAFRAAVSALVAESAGARAAEFELARFAGRLFDLQRRHRIRAAPEFVFPLLSLLVVEGIVRRMDETVDFQSIAFPVLFEALGGTTAAPPPSSARRPVIVVRGSRY